MDHMNNQKAVSMSGTEVVDAKDTSAAELLGIRLQRLIEQLDDLKTLLNVMLSQYQPQEPTTNDPCPPASPPYSHGPYFNNRFMELDEGFSLIDQCRMAILKTEL